MRGGGEEEGKAALEGGEAAPKGRQAALWGEEAVPQGEKAVAQGEKAVPHGEETGEEAAAITCANCTSCPFAWSAGVDEGGGAKEADGSASTVDRGQGGMAAEDAGALGSI